MMLPRFTSSGKSGPVRAEESGLTLMEAICSVAIMMLVMVTVMNYFCSMGRSLSSCTSQCVLDEQGGYALQLIQSRVRLATLVSNNSSGTILTIGMDDNPLVDSDGDGITWDDKDHYEQFQVQTIGPTNSLTNQLIYIPDTRSNTQTILITCGVRNLPGWNYFTVTNTATVLIRYGIVDTYTNDRYQSFEIQGSAVALNRKAGTNVIAILPY